MLIRRVEAVLVEKQFYLNKDRCHLLIVKTGTKNKKNIRTLTPHFRILEIRKYIRMNNM